MIIKTHNVEKHVVKEHSEINKIKLEVFMLVDNENNVLEARKDLIENLIGQKEVENVGKNDTFIDVDNLR